MTLNLESYFAVILGPDNQARNEALEQLKQFSQNPNFSTILLQIILNEECIPTYRILSLAIFLYLGVIFPPDAFYQLLLIPNIDQKEIRFVNELSVLLGRNITNENQIQAIFSFPSEQPTPIETYERLSILNEFLNWSTPAFERDIIQFCLAVITQTSEISPEAENLDIILKIRQLAASNIGILIDEAENLDENYSTILFSLFSLPISNPLNLPIISTMLSSARKYFYIPDLYNICLSQCVELGSMAPLTSHYLNYADDLTFVLRKIFLNLDDDQYDINIFISSLISCCLLNDSIIQSWDEDWSSFLLEYINNDEYDYNIEKSDSDESSGSIISMRAYVLDILSQKEAYSDAAIEICKGIMKLSPYHTEVAYYFLSKLLDGSSITDIGDFPSPSEEDFLLFGRYLILISVLHYDIDGGIIDECIESDNPIMIYLTSLAIIKSNDKTFTDRIPAMALKLLSMTFIYEFPESQYHLRIISNLIMKDPRLFIDNLQNLSEILLQIFQSVLQFSDAYEPIIEIFDSIMEEIPESLEFMQNFLFEFIGPFFASSVETSNSDLMFISINFLSTIFSRSSDCTVPVEKLQPVVELFLKAINDSYLYHNLVYEKSSNPSVEVPDTDVLSLEKPLVTESIMKFAVFIAQTPFASTFVVWYIQALLSPHIIPGSAFRYMPSIVFHIFHSVDDHACHIELLKALFHRREVDQQQVDKQSKTIQMGVIVTLAELLFDNMEYIMKCLEEISVDIRLFLPSVSDFIVSTQEPVLFDYLLIIAVMFQFKELTVIDNEEEKPIALVALRTFLIIFLQFFKGEEDGFSVKSHLNQEMENILDDHQTYFLPVDLIHINHPILSMNLGQYMKEYFPPLESIPEPFLRNVQIILSNL